MRNPGPERRVAACRADIAFRAILFALGLGVLVPTTPIWPTGKVPPPNAGGLASRTIPEPFAYCSEATDLPIRCFECPLEPASALSLKFPAWRAWGWFGSS